jgi:4-hydroxybenzoate polyprenyltransferase
VQRHLLGVLFSALAAGLGVVAGYAAVEGGSAWVIALAAAALALWMADLARRTLIRRRA